MNKCIGIISYLPDGEVGEKRFKLLLSLLIKIDTYFHLPVYILAQNWGDKALCLLPGNVTLKTVKDRLGIVKARIALRKYLLELYYDYYILSDDDTVLNCTQAGVNSYLKKIDENPGKIGMFHGDWLRLCAISREMLEIMNFDFIKDYETSRGELWEDSAYVITYRTVYPEKFYSLETPGLTEEFTRSENNPLSTWCKPDTEDLWGVTKKIINAWVPKLYKTAPHSKIVGIISYLPNGEVGEKRFQLLLKLLNNIDNFFHIPVYILALNWGDKVNYPLPGNVTLKLYDKGLGIMKARIILRECLLKLNYDNYILSDDDTILNCTQAGVTSYLAKINLNPNKVGLFSGNWLRFCSISREMLEVMDFDFIKDYQPERGEVWEDSACMLTYKALYPNRFYSLETPGFTETFVASEKNPLSTWYKPELTGMWPKTKKLINAWIEHKLKLLNMSTSRKVIGIISYLPDGPLRAERMKYLNRTLQFYSDNLPDVPIIIVALNWKDFRPEVPCTIYSYKNRLGIIRARKILSGIFLDSTYDIIILSDDDVYATIDNTYLQLIDANPGKAGLILNSNSLTLVSFPKYILKAIPIPIRDPYDYFEDNYVTELTKKYFDFFYFTGVDLKTLVEPGKQSTWWDNKYKVANFMKVTNYLIEQYKR